MYSRVNGYNGYDGYSNYRSVSPSTHRKSAQQVHSNGQSDSIFASRMQENRQVGDTVELRGTRRANEANPKNETGETSSTMGSSKKEDNSPIGEAKLSEADNKVIISAMNKAGVPGSLIAVAKEHLAAMNSVGNSTNNTTTGTNNTTTADQGKIDKLSEFLKNYSEKFGDEGGDVSKSEYLQNVSQMMKADMEEQGKPYIDPNSGVFDPKSSDFYDTKGDGYANVARAARDINKDPNYKGTDYTKGTDALGNKISNTDTSNGTGSSTSASNEDRAQNFQDFMIKNQDNRRYAGLSARDRQDKMYSDWKYNLV